MDLSRPLAVVTPTLDGDVLAVLALADTAFTPAQLHQILARRSEDGIRKVLRRLSDQGVVAAERVGNARQYRLRRSHLAAEPVTALARLRHTLLGRIEQALASWDPRPVYGSLFGSAARGEMRAGSDIDLLLVRPDGPDSDRWEDQVSGLAADVTAWTGNDARILVFAESEVRGARATEPVLADARDHGVTVAGPVTWLALMLAGTKPAL